MSNNLLLNLLACGLILSSPIQAAPKDQKQSEQKVSWKSFSSTESNFSIDFPAEPEHIEQTIEVPNSEMSIGYNTFISEPNEDVVYVVSVWSYPEEIDMSKPEINLQDGFNGMLSALPGSEVMSMNVSEVQGFKSLEFLVKNEDIYFQGKLILVNNTLYQVFTVYKADEPMKSNYEHFIKSFKLIKAEKAEKEASVKKTKRMKI